ncbi:MAG: hypothetical protein IPM24_03930 [Bryobacterales bacterium]|nr:hypothetical protein [Bryobacterales bacterium]
MTETMETLTPAVEFAFLDRLTLPHLVSTHRVFGDLAQRLDREGWHSAATCLRAAQEPLACECLRRTRLQTTPMSQWYRLPLHDAPVDELKHLANALFRTAAEFTRAKHPAAYAVIAVYIATIQERAKRVETTAAEVRELKRIAANNGLVQ